MDASESETLPPELERFWRTDDGLTACQRAEAYGIDLSLLDDSLRLSPAERLRRNEDRLREAESITAEAVAHLLTIESDGRAILSLTLDALIRAKRAMGRPRDLHAVLELEAIRERLRD